MRPNALPKVQKCARAEADVLILLRRGAASAAGGAAEGDSFTALGAYLASQGLDIWPVEAPYLTSDELLVLGWIAYVQRQRADVAVLMTPALLEHLEACVKQLESANLRIPYSAAQRLNTLPDSPLAVVQERPTLRTMQKGRWAR